MDIPITGPDGASHTLSLPDGSAPEFISAKVAAARAQLAQRTPTPGPRAGPAPSPSPAPSPTGPLQVPGLVRNVEDYVVKPVGAAAGMAAAFPAAVGAAGIPGVGVPAAFGVEMAGAGAGSALTDLGLEAAHRALGYAPKPVTAGRVATEFGLGALTKPGGAFVEGVAGRVGERLMKPALRRITGIAGREEARATAEQAIGTKAAVELPALQERVNDTLFALQGARAKGEATAAKEMGRVAKGERTAAYHALVGGTTPDVPMGVEAQVLARRGTRGTWDNLYRRVQGRFGQWYEAAYKEHYDRALPALELRDVAEELIKNPNFAVAGDTTQLIRSIGAEAGEGTPMRVGDLLKRMAQLRAHLDKHGPSRFAARRMMDAVHGVLQKFNLPNSPEINEMYNLWRDQFNRRTLTQLYHGQVPKDFPALFEPKRLGLLLEGAEPAEKALVGQMIASYARNAGMGPSAFARRFPPEVLESVFGRQAGNTAALLNLDANTASLERMFSVVPGLRERYDRMLTQHMSTTLRRASREVQKNLVQTLKNLGPPAEAELLEVSRMTPVQAADYYFTHVQRPEFAQLLAGQARKLAPMPGEGSISKALEQLARYGGIGLIEMAVSHRGQPGPFVTAFAAAAGASAVGWSFRRAFANALESGQLGRLIAIAKTPGGQTALRYMSKTAGAMIAMDLMRSAGSSAPAPATPTPTQTRAAAPSPVPTPTASAPTPTVDTAQRQPLTTAAQTPAPPPAAAELARLNVTLPTRASIQFGGRALEMPPAIATKYHALRDNLVHQELSAHLQREGYRTAPPSTQRRIIELMTKRMSRVAQKQMQMELARAWKVAKADEGEHAGEPPEMSGP